MNARRLFPLLALGIVVLAVLGLAENMRVRRAVAADAAPALDPVAETPAETPADTLEGAELETLGADAELGDGAA